MEIINLKNEDFHIHSLNFSDGMNTVDEIVKYSGEIGLTKIIITDHCQVHLDKRNFVKKNHYTMIDRWKNVNNEVDVKFGIEADLLNENGEICMDIQGTTSDIILLSSHPAPIYSGNAKRITEGYLNAIERFHEKISFIAHPCSIYFEDYIDIFAITELCNKYELPMEFNCANFVYNRTNINNLNNILKTCNQIYVNSDAHTLNELKNLKNICTQYLVENF